MLPQYERLDSVKPSISIPFGKFAVAIVCLPLFSFLFCVIWSILFFFEESTSTHCNVYNYLPSLSAAIGNYQPQKFVWQLAICLHIIPRFIVITMYLQFYEEHIRANKKPLAYLVSLLNTIENCALLGLSLFTSAESYELHKFFFTLFLIMSELYMLLSYVLNNTGRKLTTLTKIEQTSIFLKKTCFITNLLSLLTAVYFFVRHNTYCEPGVYSFFAFFEYIVVLTNMGFHMTAFFDFYGRNLAFDWYKGLYLKQF